MRRLIPALAISLAFAVGSYLPISTTTPIFCGGVVSWLLQKIYQRQEGEVSSGALFAAGLIAGGSIGGLTLAALVGFGLDQKAAVGLRWWPGLANSSVLGMLLFVIMAASLFLVGRKVLE